MGLKSSDRVDSKQIEEHMSNRKNAGLGRNIVHAEFDRDINEFYEIQGGEVLGRGISGSVRTVTHRDTGIVFACKTLDKISVTPNKLEELRQEIAFMATLDHPNILRLYEYFETNTTIYLIMHLCKGGELLDRLHKQRNSRYTEAKACRYVRQMLAAIRYCHENKIVHRDLKLENFLLNTEAEDSAIKLIDFGLSSYFKKKEKLRRAVGTPYYVAPEVLKNEYTSTCDIWSLGVVAYMLLSGMAPFYGNTDQQIFDRVQRGQWSFSHKIFKKVSPQAKGFIKSCLNLNYEERPSAKELQSHSWFQMAEKGEIDVPLELVNNIYEFSQKERLVKVAMEVIAHTLNPSQLKELRELFVSCDKDMSGEIKIDEFKDIISKSPKFNEVDLANIFNQVDVEETGTIRYHEFIAATITHQEITDESLRIAFEKISNRTGFITPEDLGDLLGKAGSPQEVSKMLEEVGLAKDAHIDLNTFTRIMKGENQQGEGKGDTLKAPIVANRDEVFVNMHGGRLTDG